MNKQDLLNNINADNMSKKEAIEHLLELQRRIVPLEYNFYKLKDGYYYGYEDKYRGDYSKRLKDEDAETYLSSKELREDFHEGKLVYVSGWTFKF